MGKLLLCLILGIVTAYFTKPPTLAILALVIVLLALSGYRIITYKKSKGKLFWGILFFATSYTLGMLTYTFHNPKNQAHYYNAKQLIQNSNKLRCKVSKVLKPSPYQYKYEVELKGVNAERKHGKLLLNLDKDSTQFILDVDDEFIFFGRLQEIQQPLNPYQFNYKKYLEHQHIYHQIYVHPSKLFNIKNSTTTIYGKAAQLRNNINIALKKYKIGEDQLGITNALLLGQRQDLSEEIYNNYKLAGAVHILAVSGLHIGILLLFLNFLLSPLLRFKHGNLIRFVIVVLLLWSFAVIAGLSASVVRAVTMFTCIAYAFYLRRPTNMYNILIISMFFLLLCKPMFLFDVGFQLSYAAVFAIVSIHPLFMKLWRPTYWLPRRVWELFTVSVAAQLGIIPISLLYFHQFPGLFFISNIVIVPFLGIILGMGILVITFALTGWLPTILATIYNYLIASMNGIIEWIASNESFVFKDIYFSWSLLLTSYFLIICGVLFVKHKTGKYGLAFLSTIVALQSVLLYTKVKKEQTNRLVVFHKSRSTLLAQQKGRTLKLFADSSKVDLSSYTIKNYKTGENIHTISFMSPQDIFLFKNKKLVVVDSLGVYTNTRKPDYLLLSNSPKISLERLLDSLQPRQVIADGSNYKSFVARWQATAQKRKLPFHYTGEKGAFIID